MDGIFGWDGQDGLFDEDDAHVNRNDPFAQEREHFSPYEQEAISLDEIDSHVAGVGHLDAETFVEDYIEEHGVPEDSKDSFIHEALIAAGVIGGMIEEEKDTPLQEAVSQIQRISLKQHNSSKVVTKRMPREQLRPFERWVQDVITGKKSRHDPL